MSCIRFNTPAQREAMRDLAPAMLTAEEAARLHPAPPVTASKLRRLRLLAKDPNPRIRESAASNYNTPEDVLAELARDPDERVRESVARNERASCDVLRSMAGDPSEQVRGWLAVNYHVPADVMHRLSADPSDTVRKLVRWKGSLVDA
ncbi:HEAT repeat domain-containing protein [Salinibacterium sp. dk2585]|uniref:HEAT repeat domain-containing protein n=1 Tax=unclassified Salinibacterium TaxID=2632331 RepID=UPI0011C24E16|nr:MULTISPECIES: HEAT repeat domain-containing protein [unclassified Salinibacterium]QEE61096.1 HEAT repeat domain-containing protein [Salinibacterium sp. dk2585]TXK53039.1 HEAT repeat domain-containing protein [Salinibacterium sp. dk5596]